MENSPLPYALTPVSDLLPYARNARTHSGEQVAQIASSIKEFGFLNPVIVDGNNGIIAGHGRVLAARKLGLETVPTIKAEHLTEAQKRAYILADNKLALNAGWDDDLLKVEILDLREAGFDIELTGFSDEELDALFAEAGPPEEKEERVSLSDRFLIPPFSVLNAREGWWQDRKRSWLALGIKSEEGRADAMTWRTDGPDYISQRIAAAGGGTSVFDPVICEIAYRWFCPQGGTVLDPFAGGSVRGVVAAKLGLPYIGSELRGEQVAANRAQWEAMEDKSPFTLSLPSFADDNMPDLTPIETRGAYTVKRDDAFVIGGGRGGKVRTCWTLAQGATGLVTAGSRSSPQVNIVAQIARKLGIPCRVHTPEGELSPEVRMAQLAGAEVVQHNAGYNNVIIARAREDAAATGWREIPFGMECLEAIEATARQVENIPADTKRIVMPVGSGMSLAGVLHGLVRRKLNIPVVGVKVGADPVKRLDEYAPAKWRKMVTLVDSGMDYDKRAAKTDLHGLKLDPIYEAKCIPFLEDGDLLWVVGIRASEAMTAKCPDPVWHEADSRNIDKVCAGLEADFVFSCPPYADLEVYSDDPKDLSTLGYPEFKAAYFEIIAKSCALLKPNRFAAFVVGEVRDPKGNYYDFVGDTVEAFRAAGLHYYNEAILVTAVGSLPIRAGRQFAAGRKLGKTHQNVLIFVKGDGKKAAKACGLVEVNLPDDEMEGEA